MKKILLLSIVFFWSLSYSQSEIYVIVNSGSSSSSCDDGFLNPGEFNWSVEVENVGPIYYGYCPPTMPDTIYSYNQGLFCLSSLPSTVQVRFDAFEGDGACNQSRDCNEFVVQNIPVPSNGTSVNHTISIANDGSNDSWGSVNITIVHVGTELLGADDFSTCAPLNIGSIGPGDFFGDATQPTYTNQCGALGFQFTTGSIVPSSISLSYLSISGISGNIDLYEYDGLAAFCVGSINANGTGNLELTCLDPSTTYYIRASGTSSSAFAFQLEASNTPSVNVVDQTVASSVLNLCNGDSATITVGNSQQDVIYFLRNDGNNAVIEGPVIGNGNPITLNVHPATTTTYNVMGEGLAGSGVRFNAANQERIEFLNPPTSYGSDLSVEAWVYFESPAGSFPWMGQSLSGTDNMGSNVWIWHGSGPGSNEITWFVNDGGTWRSVASTGLTGLTGWHHIATTAGSSGLSIYVDGVLDVSSSTGIGNGVQLSPSSSLHIGNDPRYPNSSAYHGDFRVSEFRLWDTERTATEIENNVYSCLNGSETGLLIYNLFSENSGTSVASEVGPNAVFSTSLNPASAWVTGIDFCSNSCEVEMSQKTTIVVDNTVSPPVYPAPPVTTCADSAVFGVSSSTNLPGDYVFYNSSMVEIDRITFTGVNFIQWTVNGLTPGTHTFYVTRTTGACESGISNAMTVTVLSPPNSPAAVSPISVCLGDDVILSATGSGSGDIAFFDDTNSEIGRGTMAGNPTISLNNGVMATGSYVFTVVEDDGTCQSARDTIHVNVNSIPTGIDIQTVCGSYTWIDGNTYTTSNNTATHIINGGASNGCDSLVTLNLTIQELDFLSINIQDPYCNGGTDGSIQVNTIGNIGSLSYSIDNGVNDQTSNLFLSLGANTYDILVTDNTTGCQIDSLVTLVAPSGITLLPPQVIGLDCFGDDADTVSLSAMGGTPPHTFSGPVLVAYLDWTTNNDFLSVPTGSYVVHTTDANGCVGVDTITLSDPPQITGVDVQAACNSYTWIDGNTYSANNNTATFNVVGGSVNGCDSLVTLDLTILTPSTGTDVQTACGSYTWIDGNTYTSSNNTATHTLTNSVGCDSLITLDLTILMSSSGTDVQTACAPFTWIDGNTYTNSNNTVTFNLMNAAGCDSLVTLDLTINSADTSVTQSGFTLTCNSSGATYQWLDCDNGFAPIPGETNQSYTASSNGNYSVLVSENGCMDTSACYAVGGIGIYETHLLQANVYPNPSAGDYTLELDQVNGPLNMRVYGSTGQLVFRRRIENESMVHFHLEQAVGLYLLEIEDDKGFKSRIRLIKQ